VCVLFIGTRFSNLCTVVAGVEGGYYSTCRHSLSQVGRGPSSFWSQLNMFRLFTLSSSSPKGTLTMRVPAGRTGLWRRNEHVNAKCQLDFSAAAGGEEAQGLGVRREGPLARRMIRGRPARFKGCPDAPAPEARNSKHGTRSCTRMQLGLADCCQCASDDQAYPSWLGAVLLRNCAMGIESVDASSVAQNWSNAASGIMMLNLPSEFSSCAFEMLVLPMFLPCCSRVWSGKQRLSHRACGSSAGIKGRRGSRTRVLWYVTFLKV